MNKGQGIASLNILIYRGKHQKIRRIINLLYTFLIPRDVGYAVSGKKIVVFIARRCIYGPDYYHMISLGFNKIGMLFLADPAFETQQLFELPLETGAATYVS